MVRRGNDSHIDRLRPRRAEWAELALLHHTQQLDLEDRAGIANLVEKDGAAIGLLKAATAVLIGAAEGAALVAEELGLEQLVGQRTAVFDDESLVGTSAAIVDGTREHFLAGPRFTTDQDRQMEGCDALDEIADGVERTLRTADQAVESELAPGTLLPAIDAPRQHRLGGAQLERQALVLLLQAVNAGGGLQRQQQLFRLPRLQQVLVDAGFVDAGDDVLGVGVTGKDDAQGVRPLAAHPSQELDTARPGHALVADNDLTRFP